MPTNIGKNFVASRIAILFNLMLMANSYFEVLGEKATHKKNELK